MWCLGDHHIIQCTAMFMVERMSQHRAFFMDPFNTPANWVFSATNLTGCVLYTCFWHSAKFCILVLQDQWAGWPGDVCEMEKESAWENCPENMRGNLCRMSIFSKHCGAWCCSLWRHRSSGRLFFKFQARSNIFGTPSGPTYLILQSQTTFRAMSKVRYTKHILQMLMT